MITEHGIYLQEREMELLKSEWLDDSYLKEMWIDSFSALCLWQYNTCDRIVTPLRGEQGPRGGLRRGPGTDPGHPERNRHRPVQAGEARALQDPAPHCGIRGTGGQREGHQDLHPGAGSHQGVFSDIRAVAVGPTDDQPGYFQECRELVRMLGVEEILTFTGPADVVPYYREMTSCCSPASRRPCPWP